MSPARPSDDSLIATALQLYARYVPFHRGKHWLTEHLTERLGVSLSGERIVRRRGLWWSLDPADYVCRDLFWCGAKDVAEIRAAREHMPPGGVMFDVGASFGYYAATFAHELNQQCVIHAFEANAAAYARLTGNLQRNGIHCVSTHYVGVWDGAGTAQITCDPANTGSAFLTTGGTVPLTSIDDFCRAQKIRRLDFMKIDVEGSELRVLRGAEQTVATFRPALLMELNRVALERAGASVDSVLDLLDRYRYTVAPVGFRRREIDLRNLGERCANILCIPT